MSTQSRSKWPELGPAPAEMRANIDIAFRAHIAERLFWGICPGRRLNEVRHRLARYLADISSKRAVVSTSLDSPSRGWPIFSRGAVDIQSSIVVVSRSLVAPLEGFRGHVCRFRPLGGFQVPTLRGFEHGSFRRVELKWMRGASKPCETRGLVARIWTTRGRLGMARRGEALPAHSRAYSPEMLCSSRAPFVGARECCS